MSQKTRALTGASCARRFSPVLQTGTWQKSRCRALALYCMVVGRVLTSGAPLCMLATMMSVTAEDAVPDPLPLSLMPNLFKASPTCTRHRVLKVQRVARCGAFRNVAYAKVALCVAFRKATNAS